MDTKSEQRVEPQAELEELLARAAAQPGVALLLKVYEQAEAVYGRAAIAAETAPAEFTSASTNTLFVSR